MPADARDFACHYSPDRRPEIRFAWNGKHADEFVDDNQDFRWAVAQAAIKESAAVPPDLIRDLVHEDAEWSKQAWCVPEHFPDLLSTLLRREGKASLLHFAMAANSTFDTLGAAHHTPLTSAEAAELATAARELLAAAAEERERSAFASAVEILEGIAAGNASDGWVAV